MLAYTKSKTYEAVKAYGGAACTGERRDAMILEHLPKVKFIVDRMAARLPSWVERDDLYGAGVVGLIDAVERFDASRGVAFTTFAEMRVRGAILDHLRAADWASRSLRRKGREVQEAYERLEQRLGRSVTETEVATEMNITVTEVRETLSGIESTRLTHLEDRNEETGLMLSEMISDPRISPLDELGRREYSRLLALAIEELPPRERQVIALYYIEELTMKEIGEVLGVTESRVSQIRTQAIARVKASIPA